MRLHKFIDVFVQDVAGKATLEDPTLMVGLQSWLIISHWGETEKWKPLEAETEMGIFS